MGSGWELLGGDLCVLVFVFGGCERAEGLVPAAGVWKCSMKSDRVASLIRVVRRRRLSSSIYMRSQNWRPTSALSYPEQANC